MAKYLLLASSALAGSILAAPTCLNGGSNSRTIVTGTYWPTQQYKSAPYAPPELIINGSTSGLASGLLLLTPDPDAGTPGLKRNGPVIMTDDGELVWNGVQNTAPFNLAVQQYNGEQVLTFWSGRQSTGQNLGHGYGSVTIMDTTYKTIATVCPKIPNFVTPNNVSHVCNLDLHEAYLTSRGTVLATAYTVRMADLSQVSGGPTNGYVFSSLLIETDIATNDIVFMWDSLDHVPVTDSHQPRGTKGTADVPWDYFHMNSIQSIGDNYLVNSRQTWSSYLISPSGAIIWEFNGDTGGDFGALPAAGTFHFAHNARISNVTANNFVYTVFNNNNSLTTQTSPSTGVAYRLPNTPGAKAPVFLRNIVHVTPLFADAEGSYSIKTSNGNQVIGWGAVPIVSEHAPDGTQLWSAQFANFTTANSYRVFKETWSATPFYAPSLVIGSNAKPKCRTAYVSWNGATDIDSWAVYTGPSATALTKIGSVNFAGFETSFGWGGKCVQARAVRNGSEISSSNVKCR